MIFQMAFPPPVSSDLLTDNPIPGIGLSASGLLTSTSEDHSLSPRLNANISTLSNSSEILESSNVSGADLLVPGRVTASGPIPAGAMTVQIDPFKLSGNIGFQQISVNVSSFGLLDLDKKSKELWTPDVHWTRAIRLADDCHTYNIQLKLQPSNRINSTRNGPLPKLILQVVRPIEAGQELHLWFSEDILAMLQVVFLSPSNIQGQKKYVCTRCSTLYESPNPLKLHITLACGKYDILTLWARLGYLMKEVQISKNETAKGGFSFKLHPEPQDYRQKIALDLTLAGQRSESKGLYRPFTECSAFKPFKKEIIEINENTPTVNHSHEIPSIWPIAIGTDVVQLHRNLMHNHLLTNSQNIHNDDAQIESLVSSLGKAQQGHICLYCGKCYSRKYGLKIHIRTHTGYKPLKCKYCERPFGDPSNLNKHVRLHAEGNTPYKCDLCGKILVRRRDLERHLKSRHMVEMHPGQNILPALENTNSATENTVAILEKTNLVKDSDSSPITKVENNPQVCDEDHEVNVVNI